MPLSYLPKKSKRSTIGACLTGLASLSVSLVVASAYAGPAEDVDALNGVFGKHPARASHAKGFCVAGNFTPNKKNTDFKIQFLQRNKSIPVVGRLSIGGGNPKAPDNGKTTVRGLALSMYDKKETWEFAHISAPHFFASTPEEFVEFLQARVPVKDGKPDPAKVEAFSKAHPNTTLQGKYLAGQAVPASYASVPYWGANTFMVKTKKGEQALRWRFEPTAGRVGLSEDEAKAAGTDFLEAEFTQRVQKGAVLFDLIAQLPKDGDPLLDSTQAWPSDRAEVIFGQLALNSVTGQSCDGQMFIPTILPAGVTASADPILQERAAAYAVSLGRRLQAKGN